MFAIYWFLAQVNVLCTLIYLHKKRKHFLCPQRVEQLLIWKWNVLDQYCIYCGSFKDAEAWGLLQHHRLLDIDTLIHLIASKWCEHAIRSVFKKVSAQTSTFLVVVKVCLLKSTLEKLSSVSSVNLGMFLFTHLPSPLGYLASLGCLLLLLMCMKWALTQNSRIPLFIEYWPRLAAARIDPDGPL